jgi:hypothetical protein
VTLLYLLVQFLALKCSHANFEAWIVGSSHPNFDLVEVMASSHPNLDLIVGSSHPNFDLVVGSSYPNFDLVEVLASLYVYL